MTASGGRPVLFKEVLEAVAVADQVEVVVDQAEVVVKGVAIILNREKDRLKRL